MTVASRLLRTEFQAQEPGEVLTSPVNCLLGVSDEAATALAKLGIKTVFDLAASQTFATARSVLDAAEDESTSINGFGRIPGELVDDVAAAPSDLDDLVLKPLDILRSVTPSEGEAIQKALDVDSIREFALWEPYDAAREILSNAFGVEVEPESDPEMPPDLVPANGKYPTERVQYEVLMFDEFVSDKSKKRPSGSKASVAVEKSAPQKSLSSAGQLDMSELLAKEEGYTRPAIGGVLTFTQSWYTRGLGLGNLIHGVALAPGESTKIAMIDWSRRTGTTSSEAIDEGESLTSDVEHSRAISEITNAVARETQTGQSAASNHASATQVGHSTGKAGIGPDAIGLLVGISPSVYTEGTSSAFSSGDSNATAWSTSSGERDVAANMSQDIMDRTHQASHSARNRRASIVREVSQSESESISTRTLTNYNHMHAMTVEYYEVVQLYRAVVDLSKADRCVFVPMRLLDFTDPAIRMRFRGAIARAGLETSVRALEYLAPDQVALSSPHRSGPWSAQFLADFQRVFKRQIGMADSPYLTLPTDFAESINVGFHEEAPIEQVIVTLASGESNSFAVTDHKEASNVWAPRFRSQLGDSFDRSKGGRDFGQIRSIEFVKSEAKKDWSGQISATIGFRNQEAALLLDTPGGLAMTTQIAVPKDQKRFTVYDVVETVGDKELIQHLTANRLYYSQAIWRSLDPATIGSLLAGFTWELAGKERPLVEIVDPTPAAIVANYLVLRLSGDDLAERSAWLKKKNIEIGKRRESLVPVPSGGVFAEAVLGRFNSAEKLDITRFWNWQDSPLPVNAPDIAPITAGSRGEPDQTVPGQLGQPVLNIVNPPSVPDPQGLAAALAAVQNGNMFRDMSGLAATIELAQAGMEAAHAGATAAGEQAGENAKVAAELGAKVAELAGKAVAAYFTGGASLAGEGAGGLAGLAGGISGQGAKINQGKDMDKRGVKPGSASGNGTGSNGSGSGSGTSSSSQALESAPSTNGASSNGSGYYAAGSSAPQSVEGANESAAFEASLGGGGGAGGMLGTVMNELLGAAPPADAGVAPAKAYSSEPGGPRTRWGMGLWQDGTVEPDDLKIHVYGSKGASPADNMGYIYTTKVGIVDVAHVRDNMDMVKWINAQLSAGKTRLDLPEGTVAVRSIPSDQAEILKLAGAITYVDGWAHELATWKMTGQHFTAFSPEDTPSNIIGIEVGKRAVAAGGSFDVEAGKALYKVVKAELGGRPSSETELALDSVRGSTKWINFMSLHKRNFDGMPWMPGLATDAPATPAWMSPAQFAAYFGAFTYDMKSNVNDYAKPVSLANMQQATDAIRKQYVTENPGWDKP